MTGVNRNVEGKQSPPDHALQRRPPAYFASAAKRSRRTDIASWRWLSVRHAAARLASQAVSSDR